MVLTDFDMQLITLFWQLTIVLRMDDKMNRQLSSCITQTDSPKGLAQELVHYGFINEVSWYRLKCQNENDSLIKSIHDIFCRLSGWSRQDRQLDRRDTEGLFGTSWQHKSDERDVPAVVGAPPVPAGPGGQSGGDPHSSAHALHQLVVVEILPSTSTPPDLINICFFVKKKFK